MGSFFDYHQTDLYTSEETEASFQNIIPNFTPKQVSDAKKEASSNITSSTDNVIVHGAEKLFKGDDTPLTDYLKEDRQKKQARVQSALEYSDPDAYSWANTASVMMHNMVTDPYGMMLAYTAGRTVHKAGGVAAAMFPQAASHLTATLLRRVGLGAMEGVLSEAIEGEVEVALNRKEAEAFDLTYTDQDASDTRQAHLIFGAGLGALGGLFMGKANPKAFKSAEMDMNTYSTGKYPAIDYRRRANAYLDYEPEYRVVKSYDVNETFSQKYAVSPYTKTAKAADEVVGPAAPATDGRMYSVHLDAQGGRFSTDTQYSYGTSFGTKGAVYTTNRSFAKGAASNPLNGDVGHIITVQGGKLNLMDLSHAAEPTLREAFDRLLVANGVHPMTSRTLVNGAKTNGDLIHVAERASEVFDSPEIKEYFNEILKNEGFDGYSFNHVYPDGVTSVANEGMYIFDNSRMVGESIDEITRSPGVGAEGVLKEIAEEEAKYLGTAESNILYDEVSYNSFDKIEPITIADVRSDKVAYVKEQDKITEDILKQMDELEALGGEIPKNADPSYYKELLKDIQNCLGVL